VFKFFTVIAQVACLGAFCPKRPQVECFIMYVTEEVAALYRRAAMEQALQS
jgi:hypothetical protein